MYTIFICIIIFIIPPIFLMMHALKKEKYYREHPNEAHIQMEIHKEKNRKKKVKAKRLEYLFNIIVLFISSLLALLSPVIIISYQVYIYLKSGIWTTFSIIDCLKYYNVQWATTPTDWYGIWKLLDYINISVPISLFTGILFLVIILDRNSWQSD